MIDDQTTTTDHGASAPDAEATDKVQTASGATPDSGEATETAGPLDASTTSDDHPEAGLNGPDVSGAPTDDLTETVSSGAEETTPPSADQEAASAEPTAPTDDKAAVDMPAAEVEKPPVTPQESAPTEERAADADLFEAAMATLQGDDASEARGPIKRGDRVEATVIQVEQDRVFVDLGTKNEAVLPLSELSDQSVDSAQAIVKTGDKFDVIVLKTGSAEGAPVVSKRKADFDNQWKRILQSFEDGKMFDAQVVDRVKGGLVVDIGVRGFVPATHVGSGKLRNIERFVGGTLPVKIIEIDRDRRKVVLSNRMAEDERRSEVKQNLFSNTKPGDVLSGEVRRITDYGAFVDLGGIDGLLHISEMSWVRIDHPREVLKEGQEINVMVLRLDEANGRVSLGLRQVLPDPWIDIKKNYRRGQKIKVQISRIVQSGAFVRLPEGAEAFLPISEMSNRRIKKPSEVIEVGQEVEPAILDLRPDERRMVLTLREGSGSQRSGGGYDSYESGARKGGKRGRKGGHHEQTGEAGGGGGRTPTGGATIGERLGMLKGILEGEGDAAPEAAAETDESSQSAKAETDADPAEAKPSDPSEKPAKSTPEPEAKSEADSDS
ncbi:MAG: S1 RNA-binding domain-containing protein [Armatimonadetes bacterium]|nr:S1 RNA-binding domain-containing protein [Armatimonadota bacterium]